MIFFATLSFWVAKSRRGSNGPVYPVKRRGALYPYPPFVGLMDPYTQERGVAP